MKPGAPSTSPVRRVLRSRGFSLVELLLVIAVLAIVVGVLIPSANPTIHDELGATAEILGADLAYARSLAMTYGSRYRVTFDTRANRYVLGHSGTDPTLDRLPDSPFRHPEDPPDQHIVDLNQLPRLGPPVQLVGAFVAGSKLRPVNDVEFGPRGETTRPEPVTIWLSSGEKQNTRYMTLSVNPVTGLVTLGPFTGTGPPTLATP